MVMLTDAAAFYIRLGPARMSSEMDSSLLHFNKQMKEASRNRDWQRAWILLHDEMPMHNVEPDVTTYELAIRACHRAGQSERVFQLMKEVRRHGVGTTKEMFDSLMNVYAQEKLTDASFELLADMRQRELDPDLITYSTIMYGCKMAQRPDQAIEVMLEMYENGIERDETSIRHFRGSLHFGKEADQALTMISKLRERGIEPDALTLDAVVDVLEGGKPSEREQVPKLFAKLEEDGVNPDVIAVVQSAHARRLARSESKRKIALPRKPGRMRPKKRRKPSAFFEGIDPDTIGRTTIIDDILDQTEPE